MATVYATSPGVEPTAPHIWVCAILPARVVQDLVQLIAMPV